MSVKTLVGTLAALSLVLGCPGDDPSEDDGPCSGAGQQAVVLTLDDGAMSQIADGSELPIGPFSFQAGFGAQVDVRIEGASLEDTMTLDFEVVDANGVVLGTEPYVASALVPVCQDDGSLLAFAVAVSFDDVAFELFDLQDVDATLSVTLTTAQEATTESWDVRLRVAGS